MRALVLAFVAVGVVLLTAAGGFAMGAQAHRLARCQELSNQYVAALQPVTGAGEYTQTAQLARRTLIADASIPRMPPTTRLPTHGTRCTERARDDAHHHRTVRLHGQACHSPAVTPHQQIVDVHRGPPPPAYSRSSFTGRPLAKSADQPSSPFRMTVDTHDAGRNLLPRGLGRGLRLTAAPTLPRRVLAAAGSATRIRAR